MRGRSGSFSIGRLGQDVEINVRPTRKQAIQTREGYWVMVGNDTESGRHSLLVRVSTDEGKTWKWHRHLELAPVGSGSFHYPSAIQAADGTIHVTYSVFNNTAAAGEERKSIKHARFNLQWVQEKE